MSPAIEVRTTRGTEARQEAPRPQSAAPRGPEASAVARPSSDGVTRLLAVNRGMRLSSKELENLTQGLETQLDAGVPLIRALQTQAEQAESSRVQKVCAHLLESIRGGASFSEALDGVPRVFNSVYRNLIRAGDASGNLPTILHDLGGYLQWTERIRSTLRQAAVYPVMLVGVSIAVVLFVLGFVFPKFATILQKMATHMDPQTRFLLGAGDFVHSSWHWIVLGILGCAGLLAAALRTSLGQRVCFKTLSVLPLFGPVFVALDLTRLLRNLAILVSAGIPALEAIRLAVEALTIPSLRRDLHQVHEDLMAGDTLTQAFGKSDAIPKLVSSMVAVGEETGRLGDVLNRVGQHYENVSRERVAKMIAALGPVITIVMGIVIGFILVTILKTLYSAIMHVGK